MAGAKGMHSFDAIIYTNTWIDPPPPDAGALPANMADFANWVEISDVVSINGVPMEHSVTMLTHLRSPNKAAEKVPGFLDAGQNTFRLNYYRALVGLLMDFSPGGALAPDTAPSWGRRRFAVVFPDRGAWVFGAFIKSKPQEIPEDNRNTVEVTLEITGKPAWLQLA